MHSIIVLKRHVFVFRFSHTQKVFGNCPLHDRVIEIQRKEFLFPMVFAIRIQAVTPKKNLGQLVTHNIRKPNFFLVKLKGRFI